MIKDPIQAPLVPHWDARGWGREVPWTYKALGSSEHPVPGCLNPTLPIYSGGGPTSSLPFPSFLPGVQATQLEP